jgi:hypothetical protein
MSRVTPEFIAIITAGVAQLAGALSLSVFLRWILQTTFLTSTQTSMFRGGRMEEVLRDLR